jgi:hypothetical protein
MTNRLALILALMIVAFFVVDGVLGLGATLFLLKKLADLLAWLAFWR